MKSANSPYYPPRAGRIRAIYRGLDYLRLWIHRYHLEPHLSVPYFSTSTNLPHFLVNCLFPGLGFRPARKPALARLALCAWLIALGIFLFTLGQPVAPLAFGAMLSIHASSLIAFLGTIAPQPSLIRRLAISVATVIVVSEIIYRPCYDLLHTYCLRPLVANNQLYVINCTPWFQTVKKGDLVAYRIKAQSGQARTAAGYGIDFVLAGPGDQVTFSTTDFQINGESFPRLTDMPTTGELRLPIKTWFIWPTLKKSGHGNIPQEVIAAAMRTTAVVPQEAILGKPLNFWPWRHPNQ
jgi:hypothetical protein